MNNTDRNPSGYDWANHAVCRTEDLVSFDRELDGARDACAWVVAQWTKAEAEGDFDLAQLHRLQLERRAAHLVSLEAERVLIARNRDFCLSVAARLAAPAVYAVPVDPADETQCDSCQ